MTFKTLHTIRGGALTPPQMAAQILHTLFYPSYEKWTIVKNSATPLRCLDRNDPLRFEQVDIDYWVRRYKAYKGPHIHKVTFV